MKHKVYISRQKRGCGNCFTAGLIRRAVNAALWGEGISEPCQISVLLTNDEGIRELNSRFRQIDRETDVLSFPANEMIPGCFDGGKCEKDMKSGRILLGDIALSTERAKEQGDNFGHGVKREIMYLTVHSVLHLLGYDHVDDGEQRRLMREHEKKIMAIIEKGNRV